MRGQPAKAGDTRIAPNGYHYTYVTNEGFILTHRLKMERILGRKLAEDEYVKFKDNDRTNLNTNNLELRTRKTATKDRRRAQLLARREQIDLELLALER